MRKIVHHLRRQPEHVKVKILYVSLAACLVAMLVLWGLSWSNNANTAARKAKSSAGTSPFAMIKEIFTGTTVPKFSDSAASLQGLQAGSAAPASTGNQYPQ